MYTSAEYFPSEVPAGVSGAWVIEKVSIPARAYNPATDLRPDCFKFRPGVYTCLRRQETQFMTDLYDEWWTQREAVVQAQRRGGKTLITGLGLGLVAESILRHPASSVSEITIIEASADVIALVGPYLQTKYSGKIQIIHADAFTWEPQRDEHFTAAWHDIWPDPYLPSNIADMQFLENRYRVCCDWQGFWPKAYLEAVSARA